MSFLQRQSYGMVRHVRSRNSTAFPVGNTERCILLLPVHSVPALFRNAGPRAVDRLLEFFTAHIRNAGTRMAYAHAVGRFCDWCNQRNLALRAVSPYVVATYIEQLTHQLSAPTVKLHLAAIRMLCDYLVTGQVLPFNPAASVRGPKHVVKKGKTPVLTSVEARQLLDSIDCSTIIGLRDRALIGVLVYSFSRVSAAIGMNVADYFPQGRRMWFRLKEKGSKHHEVPAHYNAEAYLDAYLDAAKAGSHPLATQIADSHTPLFRTISRSQDLASSRFIACTAPTSSARSNAERSPLAFHRTSPATPSEPPASRPISTAAAPSNTPKESPATNPAAPPNSTTALLTPSAWTR